MFRLANMYFEPNNVLKWAWGDNLRIGAHALHAEDPGSVPTPY